MLYEADNIFINGLTVDRVMLNSKQVWAPDRTATYSYTTSGSRTLEVPIWAQYARIVVIGGGGGGGGGNGANFQAGKGGKAGIWGSAEADVSEVSSISITVGSGGNGGALNHIGTSGTATIVGAGSLLVSGPGGGFGGTSGYSGSVSGGTPSTYYPWDMYFAGGSGGGQDQNGSAPGGGGGGGGGGIFGGGSPGRPGGTGAAWVYFYSRTPPAY